MYTLTVFIFCSHDMHSWCSRAGVAPGCCGGLVMASCLIKFQSAHTFVILAYSNEQLPLRFLACTGFSSMEIMFYVYIYMQLTVHAYTCILYPPWEIFIAHVYQLTLVSLELLYFISVSPTNPYRSMNRVNVIQGYDCSATQLFLPHFMM